MRRFVFISAAAEQPSAQKLRYLTYSTCIGVLLAGLIIALAAQSTTLMPYKKL